MSDTTTMTCIRCGYEADCINGICQECVLKSNCKICGGTGFYDHTIVTGMVLSIKCLHGTIKYPDNKPMQTKEWAVPIEEWNKLVGEKRRLEILLEDIRKRYSIDVCSSRPQQDIAICSNRPPDITNLMNSCLSCRMRETCRLLYGK